MSDVIGMEFTAKELRTLVRVFMLSKIIVDAQWDDPEEKKFMKKFTKLAKRICDKTDEEVLDIEYDMGDIVLCKMRYDMDAMFTSLARYLAIEDCRRLYGDDFGRSANPDELTKKVIPFIEKYDQEFENYGLTRFAIVTDAAKNEAAIGRNQPCSCGSGKKYKKCHGAQV